MIGFERGRSRYVLVLGIVAVVGLVPARESGALTACTAANVTSQDPGCPNSQAACNITQLFDVATGCTLDFGTRAVTVTGPAEIDIASGAVTLRAGSLTIAPGGRIEGRGTAATGPLSRGGMLTVQTTGAVNVQRSGGASGSIDVSGNTIGGTVLITAGTNVTIAGRLMTTGLTPSGSGGTTQIRAGGDISVLLGATVNGSSGTLGGGGVFDFAAAGRVSVGDRVDISGGDAGIFDVFATADVTIDRIDAAATGDAGAGGCIGLLGGTGVLVTGLINANGSPSGTGFGGGCGGFICGEALAGNLTVTGTIQAEGAAPDGNGGDIDLIARGSSTIASTALLTARGNGDQGCGGEIEIDADLDISIIGTIDGSAGFANTLDVLAGRDATLSGPMRMNGRGGGSLGGFANLAAGLLGRGRLVLSNLLDVGAGGCSPLLGCGEGGSADLSACDVTVTSASSLQAGAANGGSNSITGRQTITVQGPVNAAGSQGTSGNNVFVHRTGVLPVVTGAVTPPATLLPLPPCTPTVITSCLLPCPVCGNNVVEFPETCDTSGTPQSCDGCSTLCRTENCADNNPCTTDACDPAFGCGHAPILGCTTSTTTTTRPTTTSTTTTTSSTTTTTRPPCRLDVDGSGQASTATDVVYIARRLFGIGPVPPSFRVSDPTIPPDATINANIAALGSALDVDGSGQASTATDVVYIARRLFGIGPVPPSFRVSDPTIPPDATINANINALCPR